MTLRCPTSSQKRLKLPRSSGAPRRRTRAGHLARLTDSYKGRMVRCLEADAALVERWTGVIVVLFVIFHLLDRLILRHRGSP